MFKVIPSEFKHTEEDSKYNYNYYTDGNIVLLEVCDDFNGECEYYLLEGENKTLLGVQEQLMGYSIFDDYYIHYGKVVHNDLTKEVTFTLQY